MQDRPSRTHVIIIDGTLSRLLDGHESHAGLLYKLLLEVGATARQSLFYDEGVQADGIRGWLTLAAGLTINFSIEAAYSALSSRYQPGDRIMLFGYSRGAYAVRSLAGFIGRVGLLRAEHATQRRVHRAFRYYEAQRLSKQAQVFRLAYCHLHVPVTMIGVWDTVSALGLPYPVLSRLAPMATEFHDHHLGEHVENAFQALALDETRTAYEPLPWAREEGWTGRLEQAWFAGAHPDVGGQLGSFPAARPLGYIPFLWLLDRAVECGLELPEGWRMRFEPDPAAPAHGDWRGPTRYFILRAPRVAGRCDSEVMHGSVAARQAALPRYKPKARWVGKRGLPD